MARPRNETEAGIAHVYARGVNKCVIYGDDDDYLLYERLLRGVAKRFGWHCLAYCQMPNHVHLLIETTSPNLGKGMHSLHGLYAQIFNAKHARVGHLFQSRYGSRQVQDEHQVATVMAYLALNPVEAGLVKRPEDWRWGSIQKAFASNPAAIPGTGRCAEYLQRIGLTHADAVETRLLSRGLLLPG